MKSVTFLALALAFAGEMGCTARAQPRLVSSYVTRDASGRLVRVDQWDDAPKPPTLQQLPAVPAPPRQQFDPIPPAPPPGTGPYQNQQSTQTVNVYSGGLPSDPGLPPPPLAPRAPVYAERQYTLPAEAPVYLRPQYIPVRAPRTYYAPAAAPVYAAPAPAYAIPVAVPERRGGLFPNVYRFFFG